MFVFEYFVPGTEAMSMLLGTCNNYHSRFMYRLKENNSDLRRPRKVTITNSRNSSDKPGCRHVSCIIKYVLWRCSAPYPIRWDLAAPHTFNSGGRDGKLTSMSRGTA